MEEKLAPVKFPKGDSTEQKQQGGPCNSSTTESEGVTVVRAKISPLETLVSLRKVIQVINNLRYADDTTFMAKSKEELKSLLMRVKKESEEAGLKLSIQKIKIMASGPITHGKQMGKQLKQRLYFLGVQNYCRW